MRLAVPDSAPACARTLPAADASAALIRNRGLAMHLGTRAVAEFLGTFWLTFGGCGIRGHDRAVKLEHQTAVEIERENRVVRFTRRVPHGRLDQSSITH